MRFSFILAFAIIVALASTASAQQTKAVAVTPCTNERPSRPTIKLTQTNPDDRPKVEYKDVAVLNASPCDNTIVEPVSSTVQRPVTIEFEGLTVIEESDLRVLLRSRPINRSLDSGITSESIDDTESLIKSLLSDYGHRHAAVSSRVEQGVNESPVVTFVISEGPFFTISEIRFVGNRVFSEEVLSAKMNDCLAREDRSPKVYRSHDFAYCAHLLANFERSQGYLQTRFSVPKVEEIGTGLIITVQSNEGSLYRLGRIEIENANHVDEQDIRKMLDLRSGDVADSEKISKTIFESLKAVYGEKGFIQYTAEIQPEFLISPGAAVGMVNFRIWIEEGRRFKTRRISFKGEDLPENELRQMLLLREGDVYNQKLFEQSIRRINESGRFKGVDKDKDVDYRTNEEEGLVFLDIKLDRLEKETNRRSVP